MRQILVILIISSFLLGIISCAKDAVEAQGLATGKPSRPAKMNSIYLVEEPLLCSVWEQRDTITLQTTGQISLSYVSKPTGNQIYTVPSVYLSVYDVNNDNWSATSGTVEVTVTGKTITSTLHQVVFTNHSRTVPDVTLDGYSITSSY